MLYSHQQPCSPNYLIIFVIFRDLHLLFKEQQIMLFVLRLNIKFIEIIFSKILSLISFFMHCPQLKMFPGGTHRYPTHRPRDAFSWKNQIYSALLQVIFLGHLETLEMSTLLFKKCFSNAKVKLPLHLNRRNKTLYPLTLY